MLNRRHFLKISAVAAVGLAANQSRHYFGDAPSDAATGFSGQTIDAKLLPRVPCRTDTSLALTRRYPWLKFGEKPAGLVQIADTCILPGGLAGEPTVGKLGERVVEPAAGGSFLPWSPLFQRPTTLYQADSALQAVAKTTRLYIKDEGSVVSPLYGNKIRKYEFLLPNLAVSGVKKLYTHGAFGSNHCAHLTLAARYGSFRPGGDPTPMDIEIMLYPQEITANVVTKLKLLVACGAKLSFLDGDTSVGLSILKAQLKSRFSDDTSVAYVPPGGSSPLTVLGHVEALMELAEQVEAGASPLVSPPDYIFVPLGSGATAMGLVLGCHLAGWPTKVVGTCSQDKSRIARLAVNGDADTPFLVANAQKLLEHALVWVNRMGLPSGTRQAQALSSQELLRRGFAYDNVTWLPHYGVVTSEIQREATAAGAGGLVLDHTFSAKSFHTLRIYAENGLLKNKSALFWNTYQRFPLEKLLPENHDWARALPEPIRARVDAYQKLAGNYSAPCVA
jgi:1-aminocyclopropane-1-carboxylate deaminase/D-cysteine desulfhydrase-like pyridoxal-dependent ACC family enzyme